MDREWEVDREGGRGCECRGWWVVGSGSSTNLSEREREGRLKG